MTLRRQPSRLLRLASSSSLALRESLGYSPSWAALRPRQQTLWHAINCPRFAQRNVHSSCVKLNATDALPPWSTASDLKGKGKAEAPVTELSVTGLSSNVTDSSLWRDFAGLGCGQIVNAYVAKDGSRIGYVTFAEPKAAQEAVVAAQRMRIDGRQISVRLQTAESREAAAPRSKQQGSSASRLLLVRHLDATVNELAIRETFGLHGRIARVDLPEDEERRPKGYGFVEFVSQDGADDAFKALQGTKLAGQSIKLAYATSREVDFVEYDERIGRPASHSHDKAIARIMREIRTPSSSPIKPRALKLPSKKPVDDTPIDTRGLYVRNVSSDMSRRDIHDVFSRFGKVVEVSPFKRRKNSGCSGYVQYALEASAQAAMKELNGTSIDGRPLRIEYVRRSLMDAMKQSREIRKVLRRESDVSSGAAQSDPRSQSCTLHVLHINTSTAPHTLSEILGRHGTLVNVSRPVQPDGRQEHCYAEYKSQAEADAALKLLDGTLIDGNCVRVKYALPRRKGGAPPRSMRQ